MCTSRVACRAAVPFNCSRTLEDEGLPADPIDGRLHEAANRVESWPTGDLFPRLLGDGPGESP